MLQPVCRGTPLAQLVVMQVDKLMTRDVVVCHPDDTLADAARLMWDADIGAVVVVDPGGKLAGIVTDRDACMAAYTRGLPLAEIPVSSVMAHEVWSCRVTANCGDVEDVMRQHQVRRVPIVDASGRPVGIVALNDLARAARSTPSAAIHQREVETTLAAISMPRHVPRTDEAFRALAIAGLTA